MWKQSNHFRRLHPTVTPALGEPFPPPALQVLLPAGEQLAMTLLISDLAGAAADEMATFRPMPKDWQTPHLHTCSWLLRKRSVWASAASAKRRAEVPQGSGPFVAF